MSIDISISGLLQIDEREYLNSVIEAPGDLTCLGAYADWLASRDDVRERFLRKMIEAMQTWERESFPDPGNLPEAWLELVGYRIAKRIADRKLSSFAEVVWSLARPALRLQKQPKDENTLPVGCSKFGGAPDLPPDVSWPVGDECRAIYNDDTTGEQRLAGFLCQINLGELHATAAAKILPDSGLLSFFGFQDMENDNPDMIGVLAKWFPDQSVLARRSPPSELTEGNECFPSAEIIVEEFFDLPSCSGPWEADVQELSDMDDEAFEFGTWDNIKNMLGYAVGTSASDPTPDKQSRHLMFVHGNVSGWQWPSLHIQIDATDLKHTAFDKIRLVWVDWD